MVKKKFPNLKSEDDVREFWDKNEFDDYSDEFEKVDIKFVDKRPEKKRTTIYLSDSERKAIKKVAVEKDVSMAELIRRAVRDYLKKVAL